MSLTVRPVDVEDLEDVRAFVEVVDRSRRAVEPARTPPPVEDEARAMRTPHPTWPTTFWLAVDDDRPVAAAQTWWSTSPDADLSKACLAVDVDPGERGRGVGRAVLARIEAAIPADRTELLTDCTYLGAPEESRDLRFALAAGYEVTSTSVVRRLALTTDPARLDGLRRDPAPYTVSVHVDGLPRRWRASYGELAGRVSLDAPSGDLEWDEATTTPEAYDAELAWTREVGEHRVDAVATLDDRVVAFTTCVVPAAGTSAVRVTSTYVDRGHRGHGLGLAVKIACEDELRHLDLPHPAVETTNDHENSWMVAINDRLGFEVHRREAVLRRRRGTA